jgi:zinc protease
VKSQAVTVEDSFAKLRQIQFAWHSPARYKDGDAELAIAADALDTEGPGRLYKTLVYDKQLAQSVNVGQDGMTFSGLFTITVTLRSEANLEDVKKIVMDTVAEISKTPLTDKEIARVVTGRESGAIHALERGALAKAQILEEYNQFVGDPDRLSWDLDRYRHTTPAKIRDAVAQYLRPDAVVTVVTLPVKDGAK